MDDEEDMRALSGRVLVSVGHTVDLAKDEDEALVWMKDHDYDLVVLDMLMPNKNGPEVIQDMKKTDRLQDVPVLILSVIGEGTKLMVEVSKTAEDYIEKPYTRDKFLRKVKKIVGKVIKG